MSLLEKITGSNFFIKLRSWEYWPFGIVKFPLFVYYLWLALRTRSLVFFSASNPGIDMGGMFGESKFDVLKKIPERYTPKTRIIRIPASREDVINVIRTEGFSYPVIFKPDLGERGYMVKKISSDAEIQSYLDQIRIDFLVQELVDLPLEFGIFYTRFPSKPNGEVTSITAKELLYVSGDGKSTLQTLILAKDRARLQWDKLRITFAARLNDVIEKNKKIELVAIGNHALGTKFIDGNHLINDKLNQTFDMISKQIGGFFFGRFDLRCASLEDLYEGNIKIMELNGCGAEPAHIYDPNFSFWKGMKVMFQHWRHLFLISRENHRRGVPYLSHREAKIFYNKFKAATGKK
jgi:hypothetical protein